ncbi:MAG: N-6 DNA methylase, partial [Planctomycetota bacterium]
LCRELNERFNGDLFPGKGATPQQREVEWQTEMERVKPKHLDTLAQFVSGNMRMKDGQLSLWREYRFDTIPLEFISSIYEEFVGKTGRGTGAHYTPAHIVDFMLDRVLPWDSDEWDLKVLDPACGSGIFLVKAYQRLIHRWKTAHPGEEPRAANLRQLLTRNLFGVDKDPHAVRVASFSLYLAMCDEIDPRHYWTQVQFPRLRDERLVEADFFSEDRPGFRTDQDAEQYDLVVGNAPWGRKTETPAAQKWRAKHGWTTTYGSIGPLFLAKTVRLTKPGGRLAMLQPAGLLFHHVGPARELRARLFSQYKVEEVVNLSALRFGLFKGAVSPACIVSMRAMDSDGEPLLYVSPKPVLTNEDDYRVVIEPHDVHFIRPDEAAHDYHVWTALMWGARRDLELIRRLSRLGNVKQLADQNKAKAREGVIRGDRKKRQEAIVGRRTLENEDQFPAGTFVELRAATLPINTDPCTDGKASTDFSAFDLRQLIIKQSWKTERARFQAALTESSAETGGVICDQKYVSVSMPQQFHAHLESAWLSYNSILAVYYLFLTSYRLAMYRPEPLVSELLNVPLPEPAPDLLAELTTVEDVDERIRRVFSFKPAEWTLIKDLVQYTFADFKGDAFSPGRLPTKRGAEADLKAYARSFAGVMKAGFGPDKQVCATVFQETSAPHLPVRLVAIHLGWPDGERFRVESFSHSGLRSRLEELNEKFLVTPAGHEGGIFYQRVARVYDTVRHQDANVPTVYLIKPDRLRYWTRSAAMRDADEVAADLMSWSEGADVPIDVATEHRIA